MIGVIVSVWAAIIAENTPATEALQNERDPCCDIAALLRNQAGATLAW